VDNFYVIPGNDFNKNIKTAHIVFNEKRAADFVRKIGFHKVGNFDFAIKN
jgi:hypothetical protein